MEMTKYDSYKNNLKITPLPMNLNIESYSGKKSHSKKKMINFMNDYGTVKITPLNMRYNFDLCHHCKIIPTFIF